VDWVELIIPAGPHTEELAGEVRGEEFVIWVRGEDAEAEAAKLRARGLAVRLQAAVPEVEWRDAWKRYFKTTRFGRRLVIVPSWESYTPSGDDVVLDLDPGRAFGTGAHESTKLCLHELERLADEGAAVERFLDVGTGSAILSIAAAKLWPASTGVAVDNDPEALEAARENLERNGVLGRVELAARFAGTFDVVVANIQADVLEGMKDALLGAVAAGGRLILSGILVEQAPGLVASFGRPAVRTETMGDWTAVIF
jgi:ribosomal protein L11 methyltransferase